jgi:thiol:disulfide interchange protein DsbD
MGALSALVVTTCVAPPLVAALTVIAQSADVLRGALALFALSIGMGIPLLVIGTSAGRLLPRAGSWMVAVKGVFGFLMLGLAIWMLDRLLPEAATLGLLAVLVFMAGVFLGAFQPLASAATTTRRLGKGIGLLATLYGAVLLIGALSGGHDPLHPLQALSGPAGAPLQAGLKFQRIKTVADLDQALAKGRPLMLDFYADWCVSCKEMARYTFTSDEVARNLAGATLVQADVTANDAADRELLARFGIFGPPTIVFFGADGSERKDYRVVGFMPAMEFAAHARRALAP